MSADLPHLRYWNRNGMRIGAVLVAFGLVANYVLETHSFLSLGMKSPRMYLGGWPNDLLPIATLCISVMGLLLLVFGMIPRMSLRSGFLAALLGAGVLTAIFSLFYVSQKIFATGSDSVGECGGIIQEVANSYPIPDSGWRPGQPAAYCAGEEYGMFMAHYNDVIIYGVTTSAAQDRILKYLSAYRRTSHVHPIHVGFFEKENWTAWHNEKNGASGGARGPENLIRVATAH